MPLASTSYSTHRVPEKAAGLVAQSALAKLGTAKAAAAIFFASSEYRRHYAKISKVIKEITGAETVIGSSGAGILTEEIEIERQAGLGLMLISPGHMETASFMIKNLQESNFKAGEKAGAAMRTSPPPHLLLLFPDPFSFQSHLFFDGFENACGYVPMLGGASAESGKEEKTYQIRGEDVSFDSVVGLSLAGDFRFEMGMTRSCQPFGDSFRVTRAEGNMIYEMDGRPAYDILLESISHIQFDHPDEIFQRVFLGTPMKSFQTDFKKSDYFIRNIMGVNAKKGMVACVSPVEEGEFVTFTVRDPSLARRDLQRMLEELKQRIYPHEPGLGFYFNCAARGQALYGEPNQDIALITSHFPNVPILGLFAYGEIAPVDHVNHLHHHLGVLVLIANV